MASKVQHRNRIVHGESAPLLEGMIAPVFAKQISHPINPDDMEFYEGGIVIRMALLLSGYNETQWDSLQHRTKNQWLDRGREAACMLFNDVAVVERLPCLAKNLQGRM